MLTISPSYGRDYKSAKAAIEDWRADKDFTIQTFGPDMGRQVNRAQIPNDEVSIRYARMMKATIYDPSKPAKAPRKRRKPSAPRCAEHRLLLTPDISKQSEGARWTAQAFGFRATNVTSAGRIARRYVILLAETRGPNEVPAALVVGRTAGGRLIPRACYSWNNYRRRVDKLQLGPKSGHIWHATAKIAAATVWPAEDEKQALRCAREIARARTVEDRG